MIKLIFYKYEKFKNYYRINCNYASITIYISYIIQVYIIYCIDCMLYTNICIFEYVFLSMFWHEDPVELEFFGSPTPGIHVNGEFVWIPGHWVITSFLLIAADRTNPAVHANLSLEIGMIRFIWWIFKYFRYLN